MLFPETQCFIPKQNISRSSRASWEIQQFSRPIFEYLRGKIMCDLGVLLDAWKQSKRFEESIVIRTYTCRYQCCSWLILLATCKHDFCSIGRPPQEQPRPMQVSYLYEHMYESKPSLFPIRHVISLWSSTQIGSELFLKSCLWAQELLPRHSNHGQRPETAHAFHLSMVLFFGSWLFCQ